MMILMALYEKQIWTWLLFYEMLKKGFLKADGMSKN